ncbi:retrovirus-related pol polyprotein from transposon TNT 1-94 [Tanacetum coccineum]
MIRTCFKIDVEPITLKLLNKQTAHAAYIKHTQEETIVLRDLVEHVKSKYPLDQSLESACRYAKLVQELLTNISNTCPSINNADGKLVDVTPKNKDKSTTGRTITIVGNAFPLTRFTTTIEVPLRKPTALENETPKPVITLVYSRKPRKSKTNVLDSKSKVPKSVSAKKGYLTISGIKVSQSSSSSLNECRSSKLFFGVDLLTDLTETNLYTMSLGDKIRPLPICLLSKASKTKSWLWHRRLCHLNFGTINHLARHGLVRGLPKLKFEKDHLCSACAMGKSKKKPHKPKSEDTNQEKLYLLHMDLCGPSFRKY